MSLEQELVKQINSLQNQVDGLIKPEVNIDIISPFLALPGLVGFWPMSSVQRSTGNVYDLSGQGRTLTYNGNPTFNYTGLVPYVDCDGTGDFLSRADETDLDVLGTETIYNSAVRGLTLGGWFWSDSLSGNRGWVGKHTSGTNNCSYLIYTAGTAIRTHISNTGAYTAGLDLASSIVGVTGTWYFTVLRFIPSTELANYVNGTWTSLVAGIPASIYNSSASLLVGATDGGVNTLDGRVSLCFLCANALSDSLISALFSRTRAAFLI